MSETYNVSKDVFYAWIRYSVQPLAGAALLHFPAPLSEQNAQVFINYMHSSFTMVHDKYLTCILPRECQKNEMRQPAARQPSPIQF